MGWQPPAAARTGSEAAPTAMAKPTGSPVPQQTGQGRHISWVNLLSAKGRDSLPGSLVQIKPTNANGEVQPAWPAAGGPTAPPTQCWKPSTLPRFVPEKSHCSETCQTTDRLKTCSICLNGLATASSRPVARYSHLQLPHRWVSAPIPSSYQLLRKGAVQGPHKQAAAIYILLIKF